MRQFFKGDDEKPGHINSEKEVRKVATYVNQWRFRSIFNETRRIEFFYNSGSLSGDELMKQLFNILSMMKLIEVRILGFVSDTGGNNARLNKLLRNDKEIGNILWLKPMIATWLCSTHNLKSNMNQLNERSRTFLDKDDTPFDFKPIINTHERDTKRSSKLTKLTIASTIPDLWNKMNVSVAKVPFTYETVIEMFCHFGEHLKCLKKQ